MSYKSCVKCQESISTGEAICPKCGGVVFLDLGGSISTQPSIQSAAESDSANESFLELTRQVAELRDRAYKQIIYGLLWWGASAIAMYFALMATGSTVYYFGGALGSLFHWYRAFKIHQVTRSVGAKSLIQREKLLIGVTIFVVVISTLKIVPEYFRISTPGVGTCWAPNSTGMEVPVACWSGNANVKALALEDSAEACPPEADKYFSPSARESRFTCLQTLK